MENVIINYIKWLASDKWIFRKAFQWAGQGFNSRHVIYPPLLLLSELPHLCQFWQVWKEEWQVGPKMHPSDIQCLLLLERHWAPRDINLEKINPGYRSNAVFQNSEKKPVTCLYVNMSSALQGFRGFKSGFSECSFLCDGSSPHLLMSLYFWRGCLCRL